MRAGIERITGDCYLYMKTEDDTFRILRRRSFEDTREALLMSRTNNHNSYLNKTYIDRQQSDIDTLWENGWRTKEYITECIRRNVLY